MVNWGSLLVQWSFPRPFWKSWRLSKDADEAYVDLCRVTIIFTNTNNVSEWSLCGDYVNCFCVGIFHDFEGQVKYNYKKTMNTISTDGHHDLVLVVIPYYHWLDIAFNGLCL